MEYVAREGDRVSTPQGLGTVDSISSAPTGSLVALVILDCNAHLRHRFYLLEFLRPTVTTEIIHACQNESR